MSDLDLKFQSKEPLERDTKKNTNSLDLKLKNGQFEEVKAEKTAPVEAEKPKPYKEEYFEDLLDERAEESAVWELTEEPSEEIFEEISDNSEVTSQLADEIFEEIVEEAEAEEDAEETDEDIQEEQALEQAEVEAEEEQTQADEPTGTDEEEVSETVEEMAEQSAVSRLADEIFEEIVEEAEAEVDAEETDEDIQEEQALEQAEVEAEEEQAEADEPIELADENAIIASANIAPKEKESDEVLGGLAHDSHKGKYDFINLCVLAVMVLFLGLTFVFMKQSLTTDDGVKFTAETLKTGEYTEYLSEKYVERMPMEKIMTQANVLMRKLFGKTELEFVVFKDNEPPDGPIDNNDIGGIAAGDSMTPEATVTTVATTPEATTTTPKIMQDFEVTTPKEVVSDSGIFTGRPIKTTTTKVTTTLDLPETTDETTTGKVNLIFP